VLIILEGPDCVGKSTLAENISANFVSSRQPYHWFQAGPPGKIHPLDAYVVPLLCFGPHDVVLCDRWHVGEAVYPTVMGRSTRMTPGVLDYIELFLQSRGATTLVLDQTDEILMCRFIERGDDFVNAGQLLEAAHGFRGIQCFLRTKTIQPPNMVMSTASLREASVEYLRKTYTTWIGSPRPNVLLMGDVRACDGQTCKHKTPHDVAGPAFMPYPATSGEFLFRALDPLPDGVAVANACDVDLSDALWVDLGRPTTVALGVKASERLTECGVPHAAVPHPQYVRRFHNHAVAEYGQLIRSVSGTERNELKWRPSKPSTARTSTATLSTA
jgi:thymidylate kinase